MRGPFFQALLAAAAIVAVAGVDTGTAWSQDAEAQLKTRQDTMKAQGKAMGAIKAFTDGKGELAAAQAAGPDLVAAIARIPTLFPPKTGMAELPGKSWAKPALWTEHDKFLALAKAAGEKSQALEAALKTGEKDKIEAARADMGKACGACHEPFREKKPS